MNSGLKVSAVFVPRLMNEPPATAAADSKLGLAENICSAIR